MRETAWRHEIYTYIIEFSEGIRYIQGRMRGQIIYGNARLDVLKNLYAKELEIYM